MNLGSWRPPFGHPDPELPGDDGTWHGRTAVVIGGIVLPLATFGLVLWRVAAGDVWIGSTRRGWIRYGWDDEPIAYCGILLTLSAAACMAFVYYVVGNHPRAGWYAEPIGLAFGAAGLIGLAMWVVDGILG